MSRTLARLRRAIVSFCVGVMYFGATLAADPGLGPYAATRLVSSTERFGGEGTIAIQADGDPAQELLSRCGYSWCVGELGPQGFRATHLDMPYRPPGTSLLDRHGVGQVFPVHLPGSDRLKLIGLAGNSSGDLVQVFDFESGVVEQQLALPSFHGELSAVGLGDADRNGTPELVLAFGGYGGTAFLLIGLQPLRFLHPEPVSVADAGHFTDIEVGDLDGDGLEEIVLSSGHVFRYEAGGYQRTWKFMTPDPGRDPPKLRLADLNHAGGAEIVTTNDGMVLAYNATRRKLLWSRFVSHAFLDAPSVGDLNGDGFADVVVQTRRDPPAASAALHALNGRNGELLWTLPFPDYAASWSSIADLDGDGAFEVVFATYNPFSGPDLTRVAAGATGHLLYTDRHLEGPYQALALADMGGSADPEIVGGARYLIADGDVQLDFRDAQTLEVTGRSRPGLLPQPSFAGLGAVAVGNVLGDAAPEIVVGTSHEFRARVYIFDTALGAILKTIDLDQPRVVTALTLADLNRDGRNDIIVGSGSLNTGGGLPLIQVLDAATGAETWRWSGSRFIFEDVYSIRAANLDRDAKLELVASFLPLQNDPGSPVARLDPGQDTWALQASHLYNGIGSQDVAGDAAEEILAGTLNGELAVIDPTGNSVLSLTKVCDEPVHALLPRQGADGGTVLFTCGNRVGRWVPLTGVASIRSSHVAEKLGWWNHLFAYRDGTGTDSLLASTESGLAKLQAIPAIRPRLTPVVRTLHWRDPGFVEALLFDDPDSADVPGYRVEAPPSVGTLRVDGMAPGLIQYNSGPGKGFVGYTLVATDGTGESAPQAFTVLLTNNAPTASDFTLVVRSTSRTAGAAVGEDVDGDPLSIDLVRAPSKGTVESLGPNLTYHAAADARGTDSFQVRAFDRVEYSRVVSVAVTIEDPAAPPPPPVTSPSTPAASGGGGGATDGACLLVLGLAALLAAKRRKVLRRGCHHSSAPHF